MDNKQLLERAAKAAGYDVYFWSDKCARMDTHGTPNWNPIESDADAFRLMVDCSLMVLVFDLRVIVEDSGPLIKEQYADHNNDKHAATRLAIVRAAAQSQESAQNECD